MGGMRKAINYLLENNKEGAVETNTGASMTNVSLFGMGRSSLTYKLS